MFVIVAALLASQAHAVDLEVVHQGRVLDASGAPIAGNHPVVIRLFDADTGGTLLFDDALSIDFSDGYYAARIGANPSDPLPAATLSGDVWVEVEVDGQVLGGRQELADGVSGSAVVPTASMVRVANWVGYGSQNAAIVRFGTVQESVGNGISYTQSAVTGDKFTVNADLWCSLSLSASNSNDGNVVGFTRNLADGDAQLDAQPIGTDSANDYLDRLAWTHGHGPAGADISVAWTGLLQSGDVVRVHGNSGTTASGREGRWAFTMSCLP